MLPQSSKILTALLLAIGLVSCADRHPVLTGAWQFTADQQIDSLGNVVNQDRDVSGLLIYTPEGDMSVQLLWHHKREPLLNDSIMQYDGVSDGLGIGSNTWTPSQNATLIDTYDAYFGRYEVDWERSIVTHTIAGNLRPERPGKQYTRKFVLRGDTLLLRSNAPRERWQVLWTRLHSKP